jgi:hypothetical protein
LLHLLIDPVTGVDEINFSFLIVVSKLILVYVFFYSHANLYPDISGQKYFSSAKLKGKIKKTLKYFQFI